MVRNQNIIVFLIFFLSLLTGCSTKGNLEMHNTGVVKPVKAGVVNLSVTPPNAEGREVASKLRGQIAAHLLGAGLFESISNNPQVKADYKINVALTEIDEVSGASRVLLGVLAGANKISGNVTVHDLVADRAVRSYTFYAESASHPFSGKSDISDAIDKAAEEIIKGLE